MPRPRRWYGLGETGSKQQLCRCSIGLDEDVRARGFTAGASGKQWTVTARAGFYLLAPCARCAGIVKAVFALGINGLAQTRFSAGVDRQSICSINERLRRASVLGSAGDYLPAAASKALNRCSYSSRICCSSSACRIVSISCSVMPAMRAVNACSWACAVCSSSR